MGQKIHPHLFRLGVSSNWESRWFDLKNYGKYLVEDHKIRLLALDKFKKSAIANIDIERFGNKVTVTIHTARPGVIIGRGGVGIDNFKKAIERETKRMITVNIQEIRVPETSAATVANNIVEQIERRFPFRRVAKQSLDASKQANVKGIRISIAGRLNGAEIARRETFSFGTVPLHTIKQPIDYALRTANTTYGTIGVKVWIVKNNKKDKGNE